MLKSLLSLAGLLAAASALPASTGDAPPSQAGPDISAITSVPQSSFKSYHQGGLHRGAGNTTSTGGGITKRWTCSTTPTFTWGETDNGGKGITITNADSDWRGFYIYHNSCDDVPWKYIWIAAGQTQFVSVPDLFEGRIVRGVDSSMLSGRAQPLASWYEISWDKYGVGWADVSLIRGCDGGVLTWSLDNSGAWKGFTQWILDGAPSGAYDMKTDGQWVLKYTENGDGSINTIPRDWELQKVGAEYVYVDDYHGNPVIASNNGRFGTYWPAGRP
jgi:hypothetical protein